MGEVSGGPNGSPPEPPDINLRRSDFIIDRYSYLDLPPFVVIVEKNDNLENAEKNLGNLHPMSIGRILNNNSIMGVENITRKGKNRLGIEFKKYTSANEFLCHDVVKRNNWKVNIPVSLVTAKGIVRGIEKSISMDELIKETVTERNILAARRLNKKVQTELGIEYVPSETVVITFQGKILPKYIKLHYCRRKVEVYISPVMQCRNCWRYGHINKQCRSKIRCPKCAEEHEEKNCPQEKITCIFCQSEHKTYDRDCPEYIRQKNIKEYMVFENKSYYEARQCFPKSKYNKENIEVENETQFKRKSQDFPEMRTSHDQRQIIEINQRREEVQKRKRRQDYATVAESTPKRTSVEYHNKYTREHMDCLYPPPCRLPTKSLNVNKTQEETISAPEFFEIMLSQTNISQEVQTEIIKEIKNVHHQHLGSPQSIQYFSPQKKHIVTAQIHNTAKNDESMDEEY